MELIKNESDIKQILSTNLLTSQEQKQINIHLENNSIKHLTSFSQLYYYHDMYEFLKNMLNKIDKQITELNNKINIEINDNYTFIFEDITLRNLRQYLKPLNVIPQWTDDNLFNSVTFCEELNKYVMCNFKFTPEKINEILGYWFSLPIDDILKMPDNRWSKYPLESWYKKTNISSIIIKELLIDMCKYKSSNNSLINYYLIKEHNNIATQLNNIKETLSETLSILQADINKDNYIMEYGFDSIFIPEYEFSFLTEIKMESCALEKLWQVISKDDDIKKAIFSDWINNPLINKIYNNELLNYQSLAHFSINCFREIFINGWKYFVKKMLLHKGVGIKAVNFDVGLDMDVETVCIYYFKEWVGKDFKLLSNKCNDFNALDKIAEQKKFHKLRDLIKVRLDRF